MRRDQRAKDERDGMASAHPVDAARHRRCLGWLAGCLGKLTRRVSGLLSGVVTGAVMLIVAVTVMTAVVARVDSETDAFPVAIPAEASPLALSSSPPRCALQYTAVLDLGELERRYGKASGAYRHALGNVSATMNDCQTGERDAIASSEAWHAVGSKPGLT